MIKEEYYLNVSIFTGQFKNEAQLLPKISDKMQIDGIRCDFYSSRNTTAISGDAKIAQKRSGMTKGVMSSAKKKQVVSCSGKWCRNCKMRSTNVKLQNICI